ncbi:MAG: hypothetical protein HY674_21950 [Chloroflexi bacterium]|nr:hypothetical protein [Chloroflexota bacterium]
MKTRLTFWPSSILGVFSAGLLLAGCGGSKEKDRLPAANPQQAASQLEQAFEKADASMQQNVSLASQAMRNREFEKAIVSLHTVQQAPGITLEQGMAIRSSAITLELELIKAMERGDQNARRAYLLLKQVRRN